MSEMINSPYVLLLVGLAILVFGGEILVRYASGLAIKAKVTPLIVGLTVVAIGTSSPELFASIQAILSGSSGIAVGNVVGSNIANLGLALGLTAIVRPLSIDKGILKMDWPILMVVTVLFGALAIDGVYSRLDGVVFLASMATFMFVQISRSRRIKKRNELAENRTLNVKDNGSDSNSRFEDISEKRYMELIFGIATGSLLLYYGAAWFISCATDIAKNFNISEHVIGITVVAFGTSVPEIVASVTAALKGQSDLSIGNLIGSNIMNILLVLGASSAISDIAIDQQIITGDFWWMFGTTALLYPILTIGKKISRVHGAIYLVCYVVYIWLALG
jgi:cation:H+ antiporter